MIFHLVKRTDLSTPSAGLLIWADYVAHAAGLGRSGFRRSLDKYRETRESGDKEHRRETDVAASSISPQKLYGVPVGLMFFEGAPRILSAGVMVPGLVVGDPERVVVEAYPGVLARQLIGRRGYKQDTRSKQTSVQVDARMDILTALRSGAVHTSHGLLVHAPDTFCADPSGDRLDALLCAVQAAWSWTHREEVFANLPRSAAREGWIADPSVRCRKVSPNPLPEAEAKTSSAKL